MLVKVERWGERLVVALGEATGLVEGDEVEITVRKRVEVDSGTAGGGLGADTGDGEEARGGVEVRSGGGV
jgi:hypothetical protein